MIFESLRLVQDEVLVVDTGQLLLLPHACLECRQDDIVFVGLEDFSLTFSLFAVTIKLEDPDRGDPLPNFLQPFAESDFGHNNYMVIVSILDLLLVLQAFNECDDSYGLDRFA